MEERVQTLKEILGTIKAARDSVWVINDEIAKLAADMPANKERKGNIERNVGHLKLVVANKYVANTEFTGDDIADLYQAITDGEAKLSEDIWPAEEAEVE